MRERFFGIPRAVRIGVLAPLAATVALAACAGTESPSAPEEKLRVETIAPGITTTFDKGVEITRFDGDNSDYKYVKNLVQYCRGMLLVSTTNTYEGGGIDVTPGIEACEDAKLEEGELGK